MKLGILGTGKIVQEVLGFIEQLNLDKIVLFSTERSSGVARNLCEKYNLNGYTIDYEELLKSDLDTIYIALPNVLHFEYAKKALENDKHVIIEKPITANALEMQQLVEIAKEHKKIMLEAMNIHYLPAFVKLKEYMPHIGKVRVVSFNYSQYSSRYDAFKQGKIMPAFDYHKAGGALMDINVYNLHAIVSLFGRPEQIKYLANMQAGIDTSGIMVLDYTDFKAVSIGAKDCQAPTLSTLQGEDGTLCLHTAVNQLSGFEYIDHNMESCKIEMDFSKHRLFYEFQECITIIQNLDWEKEKKMLEISCSVMQIMDVARKQAKIIFDNDIEKS